MITTIKKKRRKISAIVGFGGESVGSNRLMSISPGIRQTNAPKGEQSPKIGTFTERINEAIAAGISFDVGKDDFQIVGTNYLTEPERIFLEMNKLPVLCTLQQSLLMKYLPKENIPDYIFEVKERAAILALDDGETNTPFEIVRDVTAEWFAVLLDDIIETKNKNTVKEIRKK
jgi:hypothetical protein